MQLKALLGQPVCKHSVSMCFGRAPAPQCPQQTPAGPARVHPAATSRPGPRWTEAGRCQGPSTPLSSVASGAGQADCSFILSSILSRILVATHGFSWLLGGPSGGCPGREAGDVPEVGHLSGPGASVLPPSSWAPGRTAYPRVDFGLSAWSLWDSSARSSPCVADLSFTKKPG